MSAKEFNFKAGTSPENIIAELKRVAITTKSMDWITPIIDVSFEGYASDYLNKFPPKFVLFNPCRVEENLLEGAKLLDLCISRKHETLALEAEAILTALDIHFSEQLIYLDAKVDEPLWQVSNKMDGGKPVTTSPVGERLSLKALALSNRNTLHTRQFSSLNYGERVEHMRYLYSDTLRLCLERFYSAWIGLNRFFAISVPIPPGPLSHDGKGSVEDLTKWLRNAMEQLEIGERDERVEDFYILASELSSFSDQVKKDLTLSDDDILLILLKIGPQTFGLPEKGYTIRLLGLGFAITTALPNDKYSEAASAVQSKSDTTVHLPFAFRFSNIQGMRELSSLTAHIEIPRQDWGGLYLPYITPERSYWKVPPLRIDGIQPWLRGNIKDAASISNHYSIRNADPAGAWTISLSKRAIIAGKIQSRKVLNTFPETDALQQQHPLDCSLEDVVISFRIAIRPIQP